MRVIVCARVCKQGAGRRDEPVWAERRVGGCAPRTRARREVAMGRWPAEPRKREEKEGAEPRKREEEEGAWDVGRKRGR